MPNTSEGEFHYISLDKKPNTNALVRTLSQDKHTNGKINSNSGLIILWTALALVKIMLLNVSSYSVCLCVCLFNS